MVSGGILHIITVTLQVDQLGSVQSIYSGAHLILIKISRTFLKFLQIIQIKMQFIILVVLAVCSAVDRDAV